MLQRGRKPGSALVIPGQFGERPPPPARLTEKQSQIWREVIGSEPVEFFATAAQRDLLTNYCRRRASVDEISAAIDASAGVWMRDHASIVAYERLLAMCDRETKAMLSLVRSLRLCNQARFHHQTAATASRRAVKGSLPWEAVKPNGGD